MIILTWGTLSFLRSVNTTSDYSWTCVSPWPRETFSRSLFPTGVTSERGGVQVTHNDSRRLLSRTEEKSRLQKVLQMKHDFRSSFRFPSLRLPFHRWKVTVFILSLTTDGLWSITNTQIGLIYIKNHSYLPKITFNLLHECLTDY